ncbi:hypothetical protein MMC26_005047 [Xylographa opegraphella]|nr:hypothetical protein [Xylographa opegraphella]
MGKVLPAATPLHPTFDPYNSSSTGHQTCPSRLAGTVSWRDSRSRKLSEQFGSGHAALGDVHAGGGGKRLYDTVGAGSNGFGRDGWKENGSWDDSVRSARGMAGVKGMGDVGQMLGVKVGKRPDGVEGKVLLGSRQAREEETGSETRALTEAEPVLKRQRAAEEDPLAEIPEEAICAIASQAFPTASRSTSTGLSASMPGSILASPNPPPRPIFASLTIYINGSTAPLISDHHLKYLLVEHGANVAIALGRRRVTHVVLGKGNAGPGRGGAGGGLAAGKIEKEVRRVGGKGVKYVGVEWVLESVKAGKRLPEAGFANTSIGPHGVKSVYGIFKKGGAMAEEKEKGKEEAMDIVDTDVCK